LLLEDVSATHTIACDRPPSLEYGLALAEAFAVLHGRWWGARDWLKPMRSGMTPIISAVL
ncbi:MAG: hypothetical protein HC804_04945, partial [Anaerolineae bacterium]|nr:hypothetical protein [Anaerolineae bacterium]